MTPTGIEAIVCEDIAKRQQLGIAKYGTTVADNPLSLREWATHAYQEALDLPIYLRRLIAKLDEPESATAPPTAQESVSGDFATPRIEDLAFFGMDLAFPYATPGPENFAGPKIGDLIHRLEIAWGIIANAHGGNWLDASQDWQDAASRWRDEMFHKTLDECGGHAAARKLSDPQPEAVSEEEMRRRAYRAATTADERREDERAKSVTGIPITQPFHVGESYRTRGGRILQVVAIWATDAFPLKVKGPQGSMIGYKMSGSPNDTGERSSDDLLPGALTEAEKTCPEGWYYKRGPLVGADQSISFDVGLWTYEKVWQLDGFSGRLDHEYCLRAGSEIARLNGFGTSAENPADPMPQTISMFEVGCDAVQDRGSIPRRSTTFPISNRTTSG